MRESRFTGWAFVLPAIIFLAALIVYPTIVIVRSGRGMGPVKRISHVEAKPHKVLSFCW